MQKAAPGIDSDDVRGRRQGHYHYRGARNPLITLVFLNRASSPSPPLATAPHYPKYLDALVHSPFSYQF